MFLSTFCFSKAFLFLILELSPLEKREHIVLLFCVPFDEFGTCFDTTCCLLIAERGTNCSEFRIPSGINWFLMVDLRTIGPKNVFLSITWEAIVPISKSRAEQIGP